MVYNLSISNVLIIFAIFLNIINTLLFVSKCHNDKNFSNIRCEFIFISLIIAIIWGVYGYIEQKHNILIGNIIVIILLLYLLYIYYKFS